MMEGRRQVYLGVQVLLLLYSILFRSVVCQDKAQQKIVKHPSDTSVVIGQEVILECQVQDQEGAFQWSKDGFALGTDYSLPNYPRYSVKVSGNNYNLFISNVTLEDDGLWDCQLGFAANQEAVQSDKATLTVLVPPDQPILVLENGKLDMEAGAPYNLSCVANNGKPSPDFTFLLDGVAMAGNTWKEEETLADKRVNAKGYLNYTSSKRDGGKTVKCQVKNAALTIPMEDSFVLNVLYAPEVSMVVDPISGLKEGGTIKFKCDSVANPTAVTWKWYRGDNIIPGEENSYYQITNIDREYHGNTISCEASNKVGPSSQSSPVRMEFGPKFQESKDGSPSFIAGKPADVATDIGDRAVLRCDVSGNPKPFIIWTKKDSSRILGDKEELVFEKVTEDDIGTYECTAAVSGFSEIKAEVNLFLKGPPKISGDLQVRALQGEDTIIVCTALSMPRPNRMVWFRDGKPLDFTKFDRYSVSEEDTASGRRTMVNIKDVHSNDYGRYNCTVVNTYGMDSALLELVQIDAVPMAYVIGGVCGGVVLMVVIAIGIFCYHKRKVKEGAGDSDTSSDIDKKRENGVKMEYIGREGPLEPWRADYNRDHYTAEYDELKYPDHRSPNGYGSPPADYPDGYNYNAEYPKEYRNGGPPQNGYDSSGYGPQYGPARSDRGYGPGPQTPVIETGYGPIPQGPPSDRSYSHGPPSDRGYGPAPQSPVYHIDGFEGSYPQGPQISRLSTNV